MTTTSAALGLGSLRTALQSPRRDLETLEDVVLRDRSLLAYSFVKNCKSSENSGLDAGVYPPTLFCTCQEDTSLRSNIVCRHLHMQPVQLRAYREQILAECRKVVIDLVGGEGGAAGEFWHIFEIAMSMLDDCSKRVSARGYLGV